MGMARCGMATWQTAWHGASLHAVLPAWWTFNRRALSYRIKATRVRVPQRAATLAPLPYISTFSFVRSSVTRCMNRTRRGKRSPGSVDLCSGITRLSLHLRNKTNIGSHRSQTYPNSRIIAYLRRTRSTNLRALSSQNNQYITNILTSPATNCTRALLPDNPLSSASTCTSTLINISNMAALSLLGNSAAACAGRCHCGTAPIWLATVCRRGTLRRAHVRRAGGNHSRFAPCRWTPLPSGSQPPVQWRLARTRIKRAGAWIRTSPRGGRAGGSPHMATFYLRHVCFFLPHTTACAVALNLSLAETARRSISGAACRAPSSIARAVALPSHRARCAHRRHRTAHRLASRCLLSIHPSASHLAGTGASAGAAATA